MASSTSPWIAVGERERTRALLAEILYVDILRSPPTPAGASVGAPQVTPLCESLLLSLSLIYKICMNELYW